MLHFAPNIRKAAVLVRSLDAETATVLLAQLSPEEARAIRAAIRSLGAIDPEERADVAAEFRRVTPLASEKALDGVELHFSSLSQSDALKSTTHQHADKRFEFLEQASSKTLVPYLAREHGQTVAVVLSYLAPERAAEVLAALPARLQADTLERLAALGDTDPDSLQVIEQELAAWVASQQARRHRARGGDTVAAILAAASDKTRDGILANLKTHNRRLADEMAPALSAKSQATPKEQENNSDFPLRVDFAEFQRPVPPPEPEVWFRFEDLVHVDRLALTAVLHEVDPGVMVLALAASSDELVDRIAEQMPRRVAKAFRKRLRQLGPTRLSDVEAAQQAVAAVAQHAVDAQKPIALRAAA